MLAHHQRGRLHADIFGTHDLVGLGVFQHAVLVNPGFMGKRIGADNRLVELNRETRHRGDHFGGPQQRRGFNPGAIGQNVAAGADCHHDFFQRGISGALAKPVDGAFDLTRTGAHTGD